MAIVAGIAIDQGANGGYQITAEIVRISGGKESKTTSNTITMEGKTIFDAIRNGISLTGKRLYWSHAKVLIISKKVAEKGIAKIMDFYIRDAETREDADVLISQAATAKEIFEAQVATEDIKSYTLDEIIKNQAGLSKAPIVDLLRFAIESHNKGVSTIIPTVNLKKIDGKTVPQIMGTAIIKKDKLVGFLSGEETKDLLFIRNEFKYGALNEGMGEKATPVTLEIFKNKTKVTPVVEGGAIKMNINIETTVAIDEIEGSENYIDDRGRMKLERWADNKLRKRIESLISKVQSEYGADIFGFGTKLQQDKVKVWRRVGNRWEAVFKHLPVNVKTSVHIKNSAILSKTFKEGD
jgi:spore germination protein KC